jgi:hypothetical protein
MRSEGAGEKETILYNGVSQGASSLGVKVEMLVTWKSRYAADDLNGLRRSDLSCLRLLCFEFSLVGCMCGVTACLKVHTEKVSWISDLSPR